MRAFWDMEHLDNRSRYGLRETHGAGFYSSLRSSLRYIMLNKVY